MFSWCEWGISLSIFVVVVVAFFNLFCFVLENAEKST